jgi:type 1 glutamine amidotransferase/nicotinamidase-related amidase
MKKYIIFLISVLSSIPFVKSNAEDFISVTKQERAASDGTISQKTEAWKLSETAIIICDMWDKHWCPEATTRVAELAPVMNKVLTIARNKGVKIVHAPSDCMAYYSNYPGRKEAQKYNDPSVSINSGNLPSESGAIWPVDQSDEGCECDGCGGYTAWKKQIDALTITDDDLISDNGKEIGSYFKAKGIKNVILVGVHTNICVVNRSFGMRAMKRLEFIDKLVLMRDMTDLMYNDRSWPYINRFAGLDLMIKYIETYISQSIVSTDFTGAKQFHFKDDTRKRLAFLIAEDEFMADQTLPEFANELTLNKNIHCDFALGLPSATDAERHNIENLQALEDADLAVVFVRRRALEQEKMNKIKAYVESGRPILCLRTTSHAFDANEEVAGKVQWPEFDKEILGGNYQGQYDEQTSKTNVSIPTSPAVPNPIINGVNAFESDGKLYKNKPLNSSEALVCLEGSNGQNISEPVFWINNCNVIYTSLGHQNDWKLTDFRKLMFNAVDQLLKLIRN